jgi:hypothetical protein
MKTLDHEGGIEAFDQALAQVITRLRELSSANLPKAFVLALPTTDPGGLAAVELIICCPTDLNTLEMFAGMTLDCMDDWSREVVQEITERREEEDE